MYEIDCIISICNKSNTNSLHTNSLHSILHKIEHVIQIVVHQFVHKTTAKKYSFSLKKNQSPLIPRYAGIRKISTKEYREHAKHMEKISTIYSLNNTIPHNVHLVNPFQMLMTMVLTCFHKINFCIPLFSFPFSF